MLQISTTVAAVREAIRRHPWWTDSLLALFLTFVSEVSVILSRTHNGHSVEVLEVVLVPFTTAPVALRRVFPVTRRTPHRRAAAQYARIQRRSATRSMPERC